MQSGEFGVDLVGFNKMLQRLSITALFFVTLLGCAAGNCRSQKPPSDLDQNAIAQQVNIMDRVKVFKYNGSLQCGQGKSISISEMQKELKDIVVFSSSEKNDGMMRIQVCGSPTGDANVYEIDRKDLEKAKSYGFKEWSFE